MKKSANLFLFFMNLFSTSVWAAGAEESLSGIPWAMVIKQGINFSIFLFLLVFLSWNIIKAFFQKRQEDFLAHEKKAQALLKEAQVQKDQVQKDIYFLDQKAEENKKQVKKEAQKWKESFLRKTQEDCERIKKEAQNRVKKEYHKNIRNLCQNFFKETTGKAYGAFSRLEDLEQKKIQKGFMQKLKKEDLFDV